jgi:hypothetical protein
MSQRLCWVLDIDIEKYFDSIPHSHLRDFLDQRVTDGVIRRMIDKWLKAGVLEDGRLQHYCFDLWANRWRQQDAQGDMIIVRYADDLALGFEHEDDARRFLDAMRERRPA